ncbi:hypothetical protein KL905_002373 [Ogataea polymorpha]|uniref:Uncharacterized protein n=1 Tax=Ogataea polymorpha TaxID=460523 RepID=A0A1B7SD41_9ASCO|nr:uncharacterized protein OGAPODRAFT_51341 [Ogataea polymorpha]KAG7880758.1 hypothetical protein KL937_001605 [Ogataea polymorpha]KAG7890095.1 hypothetical protein KL936_002769 [Ogataea polymorpha]KAG7893499.1 hypothetical protein KL908_002553 [Ogataea polymorpha]KAG7901121.1 hypothetical protein KL935_002187 [Ogataea polymorpha]KAG7905474.1 hypothetical protein KL907_002621 [Ogataea polymorpha]
MLRSSYLYFQGASNRLLNPIRASPWRPIIPRRYGHELAPQYKHLKKKQKGRVSVRTGCSEKGTTLKFGSYGMRLKSEGTRITAAQLRAADNVLMKFVKKENGMYWKRLCTNIAVCIKGNATRMGKGKGAFDHWAARVPTGKVVFEISGMHEQSAKDALRRSCEKLPGVWEFITRSATPRLGLRLVGEPATKTNYYEKLRRNPTKKFANMMKSKEYLYQRYNGRSS